MWRKGYGMCPWLGPYVEKGVWYMSMVRPVCGERGMVCVHG